MSVVMEREITEIVGDQRPVPPKECRRCGAEGEWPGQPCPQCRASGEQCAPLRALAEYLRDGTWLDLTTEIGFLRRVRITQIVVRRRDDQVVLRRDYVTDHGLQKDTITLDGEGIWSARPSKLELVDVEPPALSKSKARLDVTGEEAFVKGVLDIAHTLFSVPVGGGFGLAERYAIMIVLYEMTNLSPTEVTGAMGYSSPTPLITARGDVTHWQVGSPERKRRRDMAVELGKEVDRHADRLVRSDRAFPDDYAPVTVRWRA